MLVGVPQMSCSTLYPRQHGQADNQKYWATGTLTASKWEFRGLEGVPRNSHITSQKVGLAVLPSVFQLSSSALEVAELLVPALKVF